MRIIAKITGCLAIFLLATEVTGGEEKFGDVIVHFASVPSLLIPADVAEAHGIVRSRNRIVTNVAVHHHGGAVAASVNGLATNLLHQQIQLEFAEVREGKAIYYVASNVIAQSERLSIELYVTPQPTGEALVVRYHRRFLE
jgi:hypothetical protein